MLQKDIAIIGKAIQNQNKCVKLNKHFEGSCELLSKQFDEMSISGII